MTTLTETNDALAALDNYAHRTQAEAKAEAAISAAKTRLVVGKPPSKANQGTQAQQNESKAISCFFASILLRIKYGPDWNIGTAGVDGKSLVYDPDFVNGLSPDAVIGLLAHEALHLTNKHFLRCGNRDHNDFNIAADLAINPILKSSGFVIPDGGLFPGEGLFKKFPPDLSAEEYYALIQKERQRAEENGEGDPFEGLTGNDPGGCGGVMEPTQGNGAPCEPFEIDQLDREWTANVAAAQQMASQRGNLPGTIARQCAATLAPSHDWKAELRQWKSQKSKSAYSWKRPNRRHLPRGMFLPSLYSQSISHGIIAWDLSGSIDGPAMNRGSSETLDIMRHDVAKVTILHHDSIIQKVDVWTPEDGEWIPQPKGGGGTSHVCVTDWIDANCEEPPAFLICLTDCYTQYPSVEPEYPVLWVSMGNPNAKPPFGELIHIPAT